MDFVGSIIHVKYKPNSEFSCRCCHIFLWCPEPWITRSLWGSSTPYRSSSELGSVEFLRAGRYVSEQPLQSIVAQREAPAAEESCCHRDVCPVWRVYLKMSTV